jgi:hypothetical protein
LTLANPDLVERIKRGAALNTLDPATFYGGGAEGYTDYPRLALVGLAMREAETPCATGRASVINCC